MNKLQRSIAAFWPFWILAAGAIALGMFMGEDTKPKAAPSPACPTCPEPEKPKPRSPWGNGGAAVAAVVAPDGTEPDVEYPAEQWMANIGSKLDGAGLCVFSSFEMMCRHAGMEEFRGFRDWMGQNYRGGGHPAKLSTIINDWCKHKNIPVPKYRQYEGSNLEFVKSALASGRFACVTLYHSKRYGGRISHMVNCGASGPRYWNIVDNNRMRGDDVPPVEWFDGDQAFLRAVGSGGGYWAVVLDRPGLPCPPKN